MKNFFDARRKKLLPASLNCRERRISYIPRSCISPGTAINFGRAFMDFNPENQLEMALMQAATDAAATPLFHQLLLESPLFALTPLNSRPHGDGALQKGESVSIVNWSDGERRIVPIFSSLPMLQETVEGSPVSYDYISLRGRELLSMLAKGDAPALLNPTSPYAKEFAVEEMRELAARGPSEKPITAPPIT
jgi:hypothetical protein